MTDEEWHTCHFCGTSVNKEGYEYSGRRHFLSDCRPDLVEHEIGDTCTWAYRCNPEFKKLEMNNGEVIEPYTCYAYQDKNRKWTKEHKHFYPDGPM